MNEMPNVDRARHVCRFQVFVLLALLVLLWPGHSQAATKTCDRADAPPCRLMLSTGIDMAYIETGPASGPAVIMMHGLVDSRQSWAATMRELAVLDPSLHIIAVDQRGHGATSMPPAARCAPKPEACFRMKDFAADIVALMEAKQIKRATLAGHSLGTMVAQEVALTWPARVERLVLIATSSSTAGNPVLRDTVDRDILEGKWRKDLEAPGRPFPSGFYNLTPLDADPQAVQWMAVNIQADPLVEPAFITAASAHSASVRMGTWIGGTRGLLAADNTQRLKNLKAPTLVLWGVQDAIYTHADQEAIKRALTPAVRNHGLVAFWKQYGVLPLPASGAQENDIGHNVQWTAPHAVAKDIAAFIKTGAPTRDRVHAGKAPNLLDLIVEPGQADVVQIGH